MSIQVSEALTKFGRYKQDIGNLDTATFIDWCQNIANDIYRKLVKIEPNKFIGTQNYSVINGTQSLPTDFGDIQGLGTGFYLVSNSQIQATRLAQTYIGSEQQGFYLQGQSSVVFTGFQTAQTYTLRYAKSLTQIVDENSYFTLDTLSTGVELIPTQYMDFLVKALDLYYTQWDNVETAESFADTRYVRLLNEFLENYLRTPTIYPTEDNFSNYGFNGSFYNFYSQ